MTTIAQPINQSSLVYKKERILFAIGFVISAAFWIALLIGTKGRVLVYILLFSIFYLFAQSALISWIKGNGIKITANQYPDIYERLVSSCQKLNMKFIPEAYLMNGGGILNAFATRFLGRDFIILYSNIVDAMTEKPDALNFYIGHELGHIKRNHIVWGVFLSVANILPILGFAYSRSREYTCDQHGLACCDNPQSAVYGLAALAAGEKRWNTLNMDSYFEQLKDTGGFWMSFHELISDYPWLVKRVARINNVSYKKPSRNIFAWLLALFIPRFGNIGGGAGSMMVVVAMIGILAAIALPAYQDYTIRAKTSEALGALSSSREIIAEHYAKDGAMPASDQIEIKDSRYASSVNWVKYDGNKGELVLTLTTDVSLAGAAGQTVLLEATGDPITGAVNFECKPGSIAPKYLPSSCKP